MLRWSTWREDLAWAVVGAVVAVIVVSAAIMALGALVS